MRKSLLLLIVAAYASVSPPASAAFTKCLYFSGTADAIVKSDAIEGALASLREAIDKWKAEHGVTGPSSETAQKPRPHPYWRSEVSPDLFLPPDTVTDKTYTLCWKGVVSPVVCTAGTKLCW